MLEEVATARPRIWKFSHGTDKTTPSLKGVKRDQLILDHILTIYRDTPAPGTGVRGQGELFRNEMMPEDLFYLCHGNELQLFGRVVSDLLRRRAEWPQRRYDVIARCLPNAGKYGGPKKWWSPSGNTTCWRIQPGELAEFERRILLPFFGMRLDEISARSGIADGAAREVKATDGYSSGPFTPFPDGAMPPLSDRSSGKSRLLFDPDKIGKRKDAHQECLYQFLDLFPRDRERRSRECDLLVVGRPGVLLVEVKTLRNDERDQLRLAFGQLFWYEHFSVAPRYAKSKVFRLLVTDRAPQRDLVDFFEGHRIGSVWFQRNKQMSCSDFAGRIMKLFGATLGSTD